MDSAFQKSQQKKTVQQPTHLKQPTRIVLVGSFDEVSQPGNLAVKQFDAAPGHISRHFEEEILGADNRRAHSFGKDTNWFLFSGCCTNWFINAVKTMSLKKMTGNGLYIPPIKMVMFIIV